MSFQQGLSGLNAAARNLDVIGHNVANANTVGAKGSRAEFADMYANTMNRAGGSDIGIGVRLASVAQQFTQGPVTSTENPLDLAINGAGFFQVSNGRDAPMYTRNGQFKVDREGYIVNNDNLQLLGYAADASGQIIPSQAGPLRLPTAGISPEATTRVGMEMNLDARLPVTGGATDPVFNANDPATYNNATSVTAYDEKGQDVALTFYFRKTDSGQWDIHATANGDAVGTGPIAQVAFSSDGSQATTTPNPAAFDIPGVTSASGGQTLPINGVALNLNNLTEYGANFAVTDLSQDGFAPGQMSDLTIDDTGVIMARYTNGKSRPAGQIAIANFRNPQGLQPLGGNAWGITHASGTPVVGTPGDGNLGVLQSKALEESNVDLTQELVNMITAQRTYQANAQTIKTQDQILQTVVSLR